jgi:hypothetical protein
VETSIVISLLIVVVVVLYYLMPLVVHRLKTRKVRIVVVDSYGSKKTNVLYLYPDDPLWKVVKADTYGKYVQR